MGGDEHGDALLALPLDVTDRDAVFETVGRAHEHFGRLDIVVNNAGYGQFGMVEELSEQEARDQIETNLFGALWVTQAALPLLREQGSGHFLQVSSIGGISAFPGIGMYHASKWALEGFSQALAAEVRDFGIHVTLMEPGGFSTGLGRLVGAARGAAGGLRALARGVEAAPRGQHAGRPDGLGRGGAADRRRRRAAAARVLRQRAARHRGEGLREPARGVAGVAAGRRLAQG
jgi:NAD(P)-dependent dehydrogenase (short-subunit alcohol dehydrogenase family)